jgi:hypothetical protein
MKTYNDYEEVVKKRKLTGIFCDKCGIEMPMDNLYKVNNFTLTREAGIMYPEGGGGNKWFIQDLCDDCIDELYSVLISWGVRITEKEWNA